MYNISKFFYKKLYCINSSLNTKNNELYKYECYDNEKDAIKYKNNIENIIKCNKQYYDISLLLINKINSILLIHKNNELESLYNELKTLNYKNTIKDYKISIINIHLIFNNLCIINYTIINKYNFIMSNNEFLNNITKQFNIYKKVIDYSINEYSYIRKSKYPPI